MKLSKNFTLAELCKSGTALRFGIDNTPNSDQMLALKNLAEHILQPVRDHFGVPFVPNSGLRCETLEKQICWGGNDDKSSFARWCKNPKRNLAVNQDSWMQYFLRKSHPTGQAADFEVPGISNMDLAVWIANNLGFDQLILEFWSPDDPHAGWVHCSFRKEGNRREILTIGAGGTSAGLGD